MSWYYIVNGIRRFADWLEYRQMQSVVSEYTMGLLHCIDTIPCFTFVDNLIVRHVRCGGIGIIRTCWSPSDEPPRFYVEWISSPCGLIGNERSIWVSGRNMEFESLFFSKWKAEGTI